MRSPPARRCGGGATSAAGETGLLLNGLPVLGGVAVVGVVVGVAVAESWLALLWLKPSEGDAPRSGEPGERGMNDEQLCIALQSQKKKAERRLSDWDTQTKTENWCATRFERKGSSLLVFLHKTALAQLNRRLTHK